MSDLPFSLVFPLFFFFFPSRVRQAFERRFVTSIFERVLDFAFLKDDGGRVESRNERRMYVRIAEKKFSVDFSRRRFFNIFFFIRFDKVFFDVNRNEWWTYMLNMFAQILIHNF